MLVKKDESLRDTFKQTAAGEDPNSLLEHVETLPVAALLIDEAQFFTPKQVDDMLRIAVLDNVPVLAYGIRTDFQTTAFPERAGL